MEAVGSASAIIGIVGFGLSIATTLQTYIESTKEADERIRNVAYEVSSTASALAQLQTLIELDEKAEANKKVFKKDGLRAVTDTATQCNVVFKRIVVHLNSAGYADNNVARQQLGSELKISKTNQLKWPWLEPRISRCRKELERLLFKLFLILQVVSLAQLHRSDANGVQNDSMKKELEERVLALSEKEKQAAQRLRDDSESNSLPDVSTTVNDPWSRSLVALMDPEPNADRGLVLSPTDPNGNSNNTEINRGVPESTQIQKGADDLSAMGEPQDQLSSCLTPLPMVTIRTPDEQQGVQPTQYEDPKTDAGEEDLFDLEAWIARGIHNILKMPVEQDEIKIRMQEVMNEKSHRPWDDLLALPAIRQKEVAKVLEVAKQQDKENDALTRILAAILIMEPNPVVPIRERSFGDINTPTMLIFLKIKKQEERKYKEKLEVDMMEAGTTYRQIAAVLKKEKGEGLALPERPTYTRMSRRHISIEALRAHRIDFEFDTDPEYVIIKRWVPKYEQDFLWNHTRQIRETRHHHFQSTAPSPHHGGPQGGVELVVQKEAVGRRRREDRLEFVRKRKPTPSPLLYFFAGVRTSRPRPSINSTAESSDAGESSKSKKRWFTQQPSFLRRPSFFHWPLRRTPDSGAQEQSYEREEEVIPGSRPLPMSGPVDEGRVHELASYPDTVLPNHDYILGLADPEYQASPGPTVPGGLMQNSPATFQCTLCPAHFTRAYDLRPHLQTHTDEGGEETNPDTIGVENGSGTDSREKEEHWAEILQGEQFGPLMRVRQHRRASSTEDISDSVFDLVHDPVPDEKVVDDLLSSWTTVFDKESL